MLYSFKQWLYMRRWERSNRLWAENTYKKKARSKALNDFRKKNGRK